MDGHYVLRTTLLRPSLFIYVCCNGHFFLVYSFWIIWVSPLSPDVLNSPLFNTSRLWPFQWYFMCLGDLVWLQKEITKKVNLKDTFFLSSQEVIGKWAQPACYQCWVQKPVWGAQVPEELIPRTSGQAPSMLYTSFFRRPCETMPDIILHLFSPKWYILFELLVC